jgi:hypothetical protein
MTFADLSSTAILVIAMITAAGALFGGAVGHWRRGSGFIVTGAIIGAVTMLILSIVGTVYTVAAIIVAIVLGLLAAFASIFA